MNRRLMFFLSEHLYKTCDIEKGRYENDFHILIISNVCRTVLRINSNEIDVNIINGSGNIVESFFTELNANLHEKYKRIINFH